MKTLLILLLSTTLSFAAGPFGDFWAQSVSFTRPSDTTAYASGDLVANSTTAGSVVPVTFSPAPGGGTQIIIERLKLAKSGTSTTNASFRVHLYNASPTVAAGDNGAFSSNQMATYLGQFDVTVGQAFTDGATGFVAVGDNIIVLTGSLYALIEARGAYTPVSAEVFTLSIEAANNR